MGDTDAATSDPDTGRKRLDAVTKATRFSLVQDFLGHPEGLSTLKELDTSTRAGVERRSASTWGASSRRVKPCVNHVSPPDGSLDSRNKTKLHTIQCHGA